MSRNVKEELLKTLVDNGVNYEIEGEGEKEVIILDKESVDKSFAIPQLKALILDCLENSREYGVELMLLATSNSVRLRRLKAKTELIDFLRSHNCPFTVETDMDKRVGLYQDDEETIHIDFDNCEKTKEFKEAIGKAELNGVYFLDTKEYEFISNSCITKETVLNNLEKFNRIEKRTKEKYNMGEDNEKLFKAIESFYLSENESYLKELIDIATRNDLFIEISSTGTSLDINHEGSTLLNLKLISELSEEVKNEIGKATSLLVNKEDNINYSSRTTGKCKLAQTLVELGKVISDNNKDKGITVEDITTCVTKFIAGGCLITEEEKEMFGDKIPTEVSSLIEKVAKEKDNLVQLTEEGRDKLLSEVMREARENLEIDSVEMVTISKEENDRILSELIVGGVDSYEPSIEEYEEALEQADSLYEESLDYVNNYALPQSKSPKYTKKNYDSKEYLELSSKATELMIKFAKDRVANYSLNEIIDKTNKEIPQFSRNLVVDLAVELLGDFAFYRKEVVEIARKEYNDLVKKPDKKEREVKSIDFFKDTNPESARVDENSIKLEGNSHLDGKDPVRVIMESSQNKKEVIEKFDKYCDEQKRLILEGQLTKQLIEEGIAYEIKDGIVILKDDLDKISNNPKLSYDVIEGLEAGRVLVLDENADYRDGSKILDEIRKVADKFGEEVKSVSNLCERLQNEAVSIITENKERMEYVGETLAKKGIPMLLNSEELTPEQKEVVSILGKHSSPKEIGENAYQMELTPKGFKVVNDTPFEYMRKVLSNRKVTFYTKKDNTYFLETKEGLLERTEQSLHEDIANCKFDVLIFKDGFKETKGKEDSVSLGDSRFIKLLEAINEPKDLNTILNLGEQLEFNIARFDGVVDFSSYAEVVLSFCIGDRGFECNTTVDRETRKAETVRDVLTKRGRANGFHMLLTSEEPTSQQKTKAVCLDKNSNVLNGLSAEQIAYKVYVEDDVENLKEFNGDAVDYKGDKFKTLRMENKQTYESIFINRNNPRVQAIIDRIEENPNWDEILRLCHVNHYNVAQVHDDVIIQDKEGNTILKFKDSKIKENPKQLTAPSDVKETIRTKRCTITTVESLQNCLDSLVNKDVDISLTYSIYCHLQDLINAKGKLEVSFDDISNLSDEDALKYWDKWKKNNPRKTHNEVIPILEDLAREAVQLNIFINTLLWEAFAFRNKPKQEVDSEVEQAIEAAIKEVSEKFNLTLGRFMEFQYQTGRNVAKKRVKELQSKIKIEKDIEKKEELTKALNNEYSVLEQAEVSIEEVDNAEACNISYFIETKVYRMIGKYKYLQWKAYIEYRAKQGAESIVLDKKNIVDDMTKYLTMSNRAMRPVRTMTFVYNKEAMKNFSKEEKIELLGKILNKPIIPYFASEILPKNKVLERICIGTRTGKVQSLPFDIYLYCEGNDLMLNYLDENLNLSGINYEAFERILNSDLTVACLDQKAYDKIRGYCNRKDKDSSRVYNLDEYMKKVYGGFTVSGIFSLVTEDKQIEFYQLNKLHGITTKIQ